MKGVCEYRRPNHTSANAIAKASIPTASAPAMTMLRLPPGTPGPSGVATLARSRVERHSPASVGGLVRYAGAPLRLLENALKPVTQDRARCRLTVALAAVLACVPTTPSLTESLWS